MVLHYLLYSHILLVLMCQTSDSLPYKSEVSWLVSQQLGSEQCISEFIQWIALKFGDNIHNG